jgi:hypothetical protein
MLRNAIVMLWMSTLFALVGLFAAAACAEDELAERIDAAVPAAFSGQIAIGTPTFASVGFGTSRQHNQVFLRRTSATNLHLC